jgi:hypothetical protein
MYGNFAGFDLSIQQHNRIGGALHEALLNKEKSHLKGLSHEMDFNNVDEN